VPTTITDSTRTNPDTRESALSLQESVIAEQCWWFDEKDGIILSEAPLTAGRLIYKISERSGSALKIGSKILPSQLFSNLKKIVFELDELDIIAENFGFDRILQEFTVVTREGAELIFSLRFDPTANTLPAVAELLRKTPLTAVRRLDLTVENKIYLKKR